MPDLRVLLAPCSCSGTHPWLLHAAVLGQLSTSGHSGIPLPQYLGSPCKHREVPSQLPASPIPATPHWPPLLCQPPLINHRLGLPAAYLLLQ